MAISMEHKEPHTIFDRTVRRFLQSKSPITWHILFWVTFVFYETIIWGMVDDQYLQRLVISLIELPVKITATYFTLYVLIDRFLVHKRYGTFLIFLILSMAAFGTVLRVLGYYTIYPLYWPDATSIPLFFFPKIMIATVVIYSLVAIVAFFHLLRYWYTHQQETQRLHQATEQLEKEKLEAELKLLKSQINPHFLFNTLNNLYALTLTQSAKAPEMVYILSQLMSYMLYDGNQSKVTITKEIQYIRNYIALEKIRYDHRLDIAMNVYHDLDTIEIAPLLILPFVENSFKHGASHQVSQSWIRIDILMQNNTLVIKVENSKPVFAGDTPEMEEKKPGIGLQNLQKRLELIYPNQHTLHILNETDTYLAVLKIELPADSVKQHARMEQEAINT